MTKLSDLRGRLGALQRRRQLVRSGIAWAALLLALLLTLVAVFAIDWFFDMTRLQRLLTIVLAAAAVYWAYRRFAQPWLAVQESAIDMALLVERQQKIDGDLVAALQFEGPEAQAWGSTQLRHAVIDYVADFGKGLNVLEGFSARQFGRRLAVLGAVVLAVGIFGATHQAYLRAFVNRYCLGSARYPTRTMMDTVAVNDVPVDLSARGPIVVRSPYGKLVNLTVQASGVLPDAGKVMVEPLDGRSLSTLSLDRSGTEPKYAAQLPALVDALRFEVHLGDARTEPIRIDVIPLAVIEIQATVTVPEYAQYAAKVPSAPQNSRQVTVFEGSHVDLKVACSNKRLKKVFLTIEGVQYALKEVATMEGPGRLWALGDTDSPLRAVTQPLRYEVQVTDEDGLQLPQPFQGAVRIKPDQKPQIAAGALTRFVLPTAKPPIHYQATDDYGIAKLQAHLDVMRKDGPTEPRRSVPMQQLAEPLLRGQLPVKGVFPLDLASLKLLKGDKLSVTLEVVDYRGTTAGQSTMSDPIVFEITDEAGILEDIAKPDYQSAEDLDTIIRQQLNIGGAR